MILYCNLSANFCNCRIKFEAPKTEFFQDDKQMPIYSRVTSGYPIGDLVSILLKSDSDQEKVCSVQPLSVTENASFVIDVDVVNFNDLKADDLGVWSTTGTKKSFFRFTPSGTLRVSDKRPTAATQSNYYTLVRRYYVHTSYEHFHRQIVDIKGSMTLKVFVCGCMGSGAKRYVHYSRKG